MSGVRVVCEGLCKAYPTQGGSLQVLRGVDLSLEPGDRVSVVGPSGCGKSTFLHLLGLLDHPTSGRLILDGLPVSHLPDATLHRLRNRLVGFVFQSHHLLPDHSALSNVMMPVQLAGGSRAVARTRALALLGAVGLQDRLTHRPGQLSGGEQQRVALARALVMGPGLVLADEPTGNLDPDTAGGVFELLLSLNQQLGSTLVVVTHSDALARRFARRFVVVRGQLQEVPTT